MRKGRTRALSVILALGLSIGLTPGIGTGVYAAEESSGMETEISEAVVEDVTEETEEEEVISGETAESTEEVESEDSEASTEAEVPVPEYSDEDKTAENETTEDETTEAETVDTEASAEPTTEAVETSKKKVEATEPVAAFGGMQISSIGSQSVKAEKSGWIKSNGVWYYYVNDAYVTGWQKIEGKSYYFDKNGVMQTGWLTLDGKKYYLLSTGAMAVGWKKVDSSWYFFENGVMQTGWKTIEGEKYYLGSDGKMVTGQWVNNLWLRTEDGTATDEVFSREYMTSVYYKNLQTTLANLQGETDIMKRVLAVAQSQEGYKNYAMAGYSVADAKADGYLWTGAKLRSSGGTGNTEYTRWAQRFWKRNSEASQYADYDWCAIFSSWCLYQAGLYQGQETSKKNWYFSYCADPRVEKNSITTSFNCDQAQVWYTPLASNKIAAYSGWNEYVHTEVDPYEIPYKPGGLIFFCWDGVGRYFSHVGIVVSYNPEKHILTYISGNTSGEVRTYDVYYDKTLWSGYTGYNSIMAYAEYYEGKEGWKIQKDKLYYYQNGKPLTGWQTIDGHSYNFDSTGAMNTGWFKYNDNWYYLNSAGYAAVGWRTVDGIRYYFDKNGVMLKGTQEINGKKYTFDNSGALYSSGWWKGYQYDEDGVMVSSKKAVWHKDKVGWWFGGNGWYAKNETISINGKNYSFDASGYWIDPNAKTKAGKWHKNKIGWWYKYNDGTYPVSTTIEIKGVSYSFDSEGYWIDPEEKRGVWHKNKVGWWFKYTDGSYAKSETIKVRGVYYTFDSNGYWVEE